MSHSFPMYFKDIALGDYISPQYPMKQLPSSSLQYAANNYYNPIYPISYYNNSLSDNAYLSFSTNTAQMTDLGGNKKTITKKINSKVMNENDV